MISPPPEPSNSNPFKQIVENCPEKLERYLGLFNPLDQNGRYLHFDSLKYRFPADLDKAIAWSVIKSARKRDLRPIINLGEPNTKCLFLLTPTIHKAISITDRNTTTAALRWMSSRVGEEKHLKYLLNDLIEDEAISSSQLEGAATTTKVAKDFLKRKRKPRTPDEKMIFGNFKMMKYAWTHRHQELSAEMISEMHQIGVEGINDENYKPGAFRNTDEVEVVDADGNTVHTPPTYEGLTQRLESIADWANTDHHNMQSKTYIHPLVKAIILHFSIGYEHPFNDGNGRVARSLFYWYMFKYDFSTFRYIAISVLLKAAPIQYGKSYLYTETDEMDLTYFIDYQCSIIIRAIGEFSNAYEKTLKSTEEFNEWLWKSGMMGALNDKQKIIFQVARGGVSHSFTAVNVKENLNCSYNTASAALNGLVNLKLFKRIKQGREWVYFMLPKEAILDSWNTNKFLGHTDE